MRIYRWAHMMQATLLLRNIYWNFVNKIDFSINDPAIGMNSIGSLDKQQQTTEKAIGKQIPYQSLCLNSTVTEKQYFALISFHMNNTH